MELRQHSQIEELEQQRIELRRREHAERLKRIMNERNLKMGMDYDTLQKQIDEKRERERKEREEEMAYQQRFLQDQRLLAKLAKEEQKEIRQIEIEQNEFRRKYQKPEDSREYDIWRPDYKKVNPPPRQSDTDPWLSISSGQKFDGEDLSNEARREAQRAQLKRWQEEQIQEHKNRQAQELAEQREWERRYLEMDRTSVEVGNAEKQIRSDIRAEQEEFNRQLALEKRMREAREREDQLNKNQMEATYRDAYLQDCEIKGVRARSPTGHISAQDYRGMTDLEIEQIRNDVAEQAARDAQARRDAAEKERREELERVRAARDAIKMERRIMRERKERERQIAEENLRQVEEQKEAERRRNMKDNVPGEDFWNKFQNSHR